MKCTITALCLLACALGWGIHAEAEVNVGKYHNSFWGKKGKGVDLAVDADWAEDQKNYIVYIQVVGGKGLTQLCIGSQDLPELRKGLSLLKDRYPLLANEAVKEGWTDISKPIDIRLPYMDVCWATDQWEYAFGERIDPTFNVLRDKRMVISLYKEVESESGAEQKVSAIFASVEDFESLLAVLDEEVILKALKAGK